MGFYICNVFYNFIELTLDSTEIRTTPDHPFWVIGKGWIKAENLHVGDTLLLYSGEEIQIQNLRKDFLEKPITVYNFKVDDWHTYFVSDLGIFVHNANCFDVKGFEKLISKMSPSDRVAAVRTQASIVAEGNGWVKDSKLTKMNSRDVYRDPKTGNLYAVDTQHGRFEHVNGKNGKHLGEVDFGLTPTKPADTSGGHNLKVK